MSFNILTDSPPPSTKTVLYTKPIFFKFVSALQSIPNSFTKTHFNFSSLKPTTHSISAAGFVPKTVSDLETERHGLLTYGVEELLEKMMVDEELLMVAGLEWLFDCSLQGRMKLLTVAYGAGTCWTPAVNDRNFCCWRI
ncbi:hypothetical protein SADUNF_Sadunf16G0021100 [Salix dunnii]|uniref:Uncharacterized protein n=1 Tax=Salix dunnii TaxID=1413687 RepID=A0A835MFS5_9ROSI|nr:hypothetical protein SADUNF_Sadunf16G0021100 [Salix dunnii]